MPQLSLYVDDATLNLLREAAKEENRTLSKVAVECIQKSLSCVWSHEWLSCWGAVADFPERENVTAIDAPRETL